MAAFLAESEVLVERMTKKGLRTFDCRAAVIALEVTPEGGLDLLLEHAVPAVRPDDVLTGLREVGGLDVPKTVLLTRRAQGTLRPGDHPVGDPLAGR